MENASIFFALFLLRFFFSISHRDFLFHFFFLFLKDCVENDGLQRQKKREAMHFGKQLKLLAYEPWKEQHLDYRMLKERLEAMLARARKEGRVVLISKSALEKQRKSQEGDYEVLRESFRTESHMRRNDRAEGASPAPPQPDAEAAPVLRLDRRLDGEPRAQLDLSNIPVVEVDENGKPKGSLLPLLSGADADSAMQGSTVAQEGAASASGAAAGTQSTTEEGVVNPGDELVAITRLEEGKDGARRRRRKELKKPLLVPGSVQIQKNEEEKMYKEPVHDDSEEMAALTPALLAMVAAPFEAEVRRVGAFFRRTYDEIVDDLGELMMTVQERRSVRESCISLKTDFLQLRVEAEELLDFGRLNLVGFTKIVKKVVRHTDLMGRADLLALVQRADFVAMLPWAEDLADRITEAFLHTYARDSSERVKYTQELKAHMATERAWKMSSLLYRVDEHKRQVRAKPPPKIVVKPVPLLVAAALYVALTFAPIFPADKMPAQRCLALLIMCMVMWVSECVPLFLTAIVAALFTALSYVLLDDRGDVLGITAAISAVMTRLYPGNVPLVLAGFSISAAFKKYKIDMLVANWILGRKFFQTPRRFVLAIELLCFFMSAWVTNIAGSVLTLTVIMPIIRDLPDRCRYIKTLLMATAMSGSFGGVSTQIASPQNAVTVALGDYSIGFLEFIGVGFPIWPVLLLTEHFIIMYYLPPDVDELPEINSDTIMQEAGLSSTGYATAALETSRRVAHKQVKPPINEKLPWAMLATLAVTLVSIVLWVCSNWLGVFGKDIGIISMVPLLLFYGTGLLGKEDFEQMPWALIMLLAGGNVLGYAVQSSKLLQMLANVITLLPQNLFLIVVVCNIIMLIASTFVSSTVAAIILLPLALQIGIGVGHPKAIVMCCVIMCSGAMALPVSSFPNMNAISVTDPNGGPYLSTVDFIKCGITQTIFAYIFSCLIPLGMSLLFGF